MGKAPAFQFYVKDWLTDPELQSASATTRGIWINALCFMWTNGSRGKLTGTIKSLSKLLNSEINEFFSFLDEANLYGFSEVELPVNVTFPLHVTQCNILVTLKNRRMIREEKDRENTKLRVRRHRDKKECNESVTSPSPSPSPSACTKVLKSSASEKDAGQRYRTKKGRELTGKRLDTFEQFWNAFNYRKGKAEASDAWLDIPSLTDELVVNILTSAKLEAQNRHNLIDKGKTPKMAQGWISGKRWEDEGVSVTKLVTVDPERLKPKDNLGEGYRILTTKGMEDFTAFAEEKNMPQDDIEAVIGKAEGVGL